MLNNLGIVVIGRNEGERLKSCIISILDHSNKIVYVDSGSTDDSLGFCKSKDIDYIELDMSIPFSAARARNAGFFSLIEKNENLEYVQFIDGDCLLNPEWLNIAMKFLDDNTEYAIVAGQRKEQFPMASVYNLLCDIEWNTPIGETEACGGDFLVKVKSFKEVDGFNPFIIAGEEPDLCYRLRKLDWKIYRYDHDMTYHDAAMKKFSQWWRRSIRAGHAYAQGFLTHYKDGKGYYFPQVVRALVWGVFFPISVFILGLLGSLWFFTLYLIYIYRFIRIFLRKKKEIKNIRSSLIYSSFSILTPVPQTFGIVLLLWRRVLGKKYKIIEHK